MGQLNRAAADRLGCTAASQKAKSCSDSAQNSLGPRPARRTSYTGPSAPIRRLLALGCSLRQRRFITHAPPLPRRLSPSLIVAVLSATFSMSPPISRLLLPHPSERIVATPHGSSACREVPSAGVELPLRTRGMASIAPPSSCWGSW